MYSNADNAEAAESLTLKRQMTCEAALATLAHCDTDDAGIACVELVKMHDVMLSIR